MSAQEAAATAVPIVGSHLVPFVSEYLLGKGAIVVQADDVDGFAAALELLLTDDDLRREMGTNAHHITIPYFTWSHRVAAFLDQIGGLPGGDAAPEGDDEETYEPAD